MSRSTPLARAGLALLVAFSLGLALQGKALAQQGPRITAVYQDRLPTGPADSAWEQAPVAELPLTAQTAVKPALAVPSVSAVRVRSITDGAAIAFLLEWKDSTRNVSAGAQDSFRDAAAIQFPVTGDLPALCMGVRGQMVNIWHWKADWQEDVDRGFQDVPDVFPNFYKDTYPFVDSLSGHPPYRMPADFDTPEAREFIVGWSAGNPLSQPVKTSPVEDLNAVGFGTITSKAKQHVSGNGVWADGVWRVVFSRPLRVEDPDAAQLATGREMSLAFAVWDGSNQEVGARKQVSTFLTVAVEGGVGPSASAQPLVIAAVIVALLLVLIGAAGAIGPGFGRPLPPEQE